MVLAICIRQVVVRPQPRKLELTHMDLKKHSNYRESLHKHWSW